MSGGWRDALFRMHLNGWNADDIDEACEALYEACSEGAYEGVAVVELRPAQVTALLGVDLDPRLVTALQQVASLRAMQTAEADDLRAALFDIDAFAYDFAGDT